MLRWENVDIRNRLLTVPRSQHGGSRHVHLSDEAMDILTTIRNQTRVMSAWCFPSSNPVTPMDAQNFYNRVYLPALKMAVISGLPWHDLRHTFCSRQVMTGVESGRSGVGRTQDTGNDSEV